MAEQILGVDLRMNGARLVVIDDAGRVLKRGEIQAAADADRVYAEMAREVGAGGISSEPTANDAPGTQFPSLARLAPLAACVPGTAAVIAEAWVGAAQGARHAVCLKIGERVVAGILLNGQPWRGAHDRAGSAAWLALNPVERQDYRKFGSLAAEVSTKGIARRLSWRIQAGDHSAVLEKAGDLEAITAAHVFEGARTGDGVSISVVRDTAKYIGMAVANLAVAIDPEVIVLSGAIASAGDLLLDPVRQEAARRLPPGLAEQIRIEMSPLGDDGIAIGAARAAMLARP
jgi:predicted NBD/HSP70 family sugar kinase